MLGTRSQTRLTKPIAAAIAVISAVGLSAVAAGPASAAPAWAVEQTPPLPHGFGSGDLTAVGCAASTCLAVGDGEDPYQLPYYLSDRWNGVSWTSEPTPGTNGDGFYMTGVSCPTATTCWATGTASFVPGGPSPLLWSLGRAGWNHGNLAGNIHTGDLNGISCTSTQFCMAVGDVGSKALAERWDGSRWHFMALPKATTSGFTGPSFSNVGCGAPNSCMAVGLAKASGVLGAVEHWNGRAWKEQPTPTLPGAKAGNLGDVSCPTAGECIAVGSYRLGAQRLALSEIWKGRRWKLLSTPDQPRSPKNSALWSLSCPSTNACAAVGTPGPYPLLEWWDGRRWALQPMPVKFPGGAGLIAVSCSSAADCTAVGDNSGNAFAMATSPATP